jgi:hypothetical protein
VAKLQKIGPRQLEVVLNLERAGAYPRQDETGCCYRFTRSGFRPGFSQVHATIAAAMELSGYFRMTLK